MTILITFQTIIFVALIAVAFSSENVSEKKSDEKLDEKVDVDTKKDKRGLWDLGYGYNTYGVNSYGIRSGLGLTTYSTYSEPAAYSVYPASHTHTVITKEIGVPVEKHIYPVRHVSYPTVKVKIKFFIALIHKKIN